MDGLEHYSNRCAKYFFLVEFRRPENNLDVRHCAESI